MSILFKFVGSSFLLTFGIILLVCGSIMLYSYRRLNLLERSVIEHGKILQNFILNYNIQMQSLNSLYNNKNFDNASIEHTKKINLGEKIYVSEDECSEDDDFIVDTNNKSDNKPNIVDTSCSDDDDDDDDDDNDDGDDDDNDDDDNDDDDNEMNDDNFQANIVELLSSTKSEQENNIKDLGDFEEIDLTKQSFSNNDDETFIKNLPINLDTFNIDLNNKSKIVNLNNIENEALETNVTKKNYSKMKVDDLKTIAVTRNLIDNESAQKMKKADLVKILQNS